MGLIDNYRRYLQPRVQDLVQQLRVDQVSMPTPYDDVGRARASRVQAYLQAAPASAADEELDLTRENLLRRELMLCARSAPFRRQSHAAAALGGR